MLDIVKAHAYGNDFLFVDADRVAEESRAALAKRVCNRHTGIGADGLVFYTRTSDGATMKLLNADGSYSEVSGNGIRCLATLILSSQNNLEAGSQVTIHTDVGSKQLTVVDVTGPRFTFKAAMGKPEEIQLKNIDVEGEQLDVVTLRVGNPQCVVLGALPKEERFRRLAKALATHSVFPAGTNVEFAEVVSEKCIRIAIWERGVGPTEASGTGACAAAVAAALYGNAGRDVEVIAPGGTQRVVWTEGGLTLTGWTELLHTSQWLIPIE